MSGSPPHEALVQGPGGLSRPLGPSEGIRAHRIHTCRNPRPRPSGEALFKDLLGWWYDTQKVVPRPKWKGRRPPEQGYRLEVSPGPAPPQGGGFVPELYPPPPPARQAPRPLPTPVGTPAPHSASPAPIPPAAWAPSKTRPQSPHPPWGPFGRFRCGLARGQRGTLARPCMKAWTGPSPHHPPPPPHPPPTPSLSVGGMKSEQATPHGWDLGWEGG